MTYKTILVHVNDERRVAGLVDAAAVLATRCDAHLIGLYVMPPVPTYGVTQVGAGMIKASLGTFREEAKRVRAAFELATHGRPFVAEWRLVEARDPGVAETIMDHGRVADLIIASQRDRDWDFSMLLDEPERLLRAAAPCWSSPIKASSAILAAGSPSLGTAPARPPAPRSMPCRS
jgi:nucleotide-binding universal stress UspA family protein